MSDTKTSPPIRVILADDHALVIEGLRGLIDHEPDMQVVATVQNGDELLQILAHQAADVVVLDLQMPYHGLTALAEIRRRQLSVRVLVLTAYFDGESIQSALELEAEGFVLKTEPPAQTVAAIRQVAQGQLVFPRAAQRWLASNRHATNPLDVLSAREQEVLSHAAQGQTNAEIAQTLVISENTVRFHLKSIFEKLHLGNRTEAAAWYFKNRR
ncbi:MAG: response regulator transcription factor [Caldilineaceae bacterium]|nr:response regulator transcription factor [Caldilineaceae bacterium]MBP8110264.1 response regulator transcription factor [Caldilineaceae bacterium]MBP8123506.1 response regulator transcription factor [Caldilineaceae bacterium]MBP9073734.1 response regulator transcription factor [Caldilineaceae bacterium]